MRSIALDASSTTIGWVLAEDGKRRFSGTKQLKGSIGERVEQAYTFVFDLIGSWLPEVLITEAPAVRFIKGAIPQLRVSGAIILACQHRHVPWGEVSPTEGKKALTGKGKAEKSDMLLAAAPHLGYDPTTLTITGRKGGTWYAWLDGVKVYDDGEADAVGVMLASEAA